METDAPRSKRTEVRDRGVKTLVSAAVKSAFRRRANARGVTESDLLRELIEREVEQKLSAVSDQPSG